MDLIYWTGSRRGNNADEIISIKSLSHPEDLRVQFTDKFPESNNKFTVS